MPLNCARRFKTEFSPLFPSAPFALSFDVELSLLNLHLIVTQKSVYEIKSNIFDNLSMKLEFQNLQDLGKDK